jgi:uncharacterized Zn-binding protein involved in type VI secretion
LVDFGVARLGDQTDHGGQVITSATKSYVNGILVARVGDLVSCPIHGNNPIIDGSGNYKTETKITAVRTSITGCGSQITTASTDTFAPKVSPSGAITLGTGVVGGFLG